MDRNLHKILSDYRNTVMSFGERDCNLMILQIYEPEMFEQFAGTYDTEGSGVASAIELFGCTNLQDFMDDHDDYMVVEDEQQLDGDIVCYTQSHAMGVALYGGVFGVKNDVFCIHPLNQESTPYKLYRKRGETWQIR